MSTDRQRSWSAFALSCPSSPGIRLLQRLSCILSLFSGVFSKMHPFSDLYLCVYFHSSTSKYLLLFFCVMWVCGWIGRIVIFSTVKKKLDGPDISRNNSLVDELDFTAEDIPLPVVTDASRWVALVFIHPLNALFAQNGIKCLRLLHPLSLLWLRTRVWTAVWCCSVY